MKKPKSRKAKAKGPGKGAPGRRRPSPKPKVRKAEVLVELAKAAEPVALQDGKLVTQFPNARHPPSDVTLEAPEPDAPSFAFLRFSAGLQYTTDLHGITVEELAECAPFKNTVALKTLQKWCLEDQWVARREALMAEWRRDIEAKLGQRQVQQALVDLQTTDSMAEDILEKLRNKVGMVNSFEGLINSMIRLMEFRQTLRGQVLTQTAPGPVGTVPGVSRPGGQMPKPNLSVEDARAAAAAIIKRRRDEIRAEQAKAVEHAPVVPEEPKQDDSGTTPEAPLRLVPGQPE